MPSFTADDSGIGTDDAWLFVRANLTEEQREFAAPVLKNVDHVNFPHILGAIFRRDPGLRSIRFTAAYPTTVAEVPCVVYTLISRTPGIRDLEQFKPRHRFDFIDNEGNRVDVYGQWMTCVYQFDCCASTAQEADDLVLQVDNLIRNSVWEFQQMGVKDIYFQEQLADMLLPKDDKKIIVRSLRWMAQFDFYDVRTSPTIKDVRLDVLLPKAEFVDTIVRGDSLDVGDQLGQTYISSILFVSDPHPDSIARSKDYIENVDFVVGFDHFTKLSTIFWLDPGKRPQPGSTYYVRYLHWTAFSTLFIP